jgi:hypothetical protein
MVQVGLWSRSWAPSTRDSGQSARQNCTSRGAFLLGRRIVHLAPKAQEEQPGRIRTTHQMADFSNNSEMPCPLINQHRSLDPTADLVKQNERRFQRQSLLLKNAQLSADQLAPSLPWTKNSGLLREKIPIQVAWKKATRNASIDITNFIKSDSSDNSFVIVPPKDSKLDLIQIQIQEGHDETS